MSHVSFHEFFSLDGLLPEMDRTERNKLIGHDGCGYIRKIFTMNSWAVVVAQLVERSLPTLEVRGLIPVLREWPFLQKEFFFELECRHSSVDSSTPTFLPPQVQIQSI